MHCQRRLEQPAADWYAGSRQNTYSGDMLAPGTLLHRQERCCILRHMRARPCTAGEDSSRVCDRSSAIRRVLLLCRFRGRRLVCGATGVSATTPSPWSQVDKVIRTSSLHMHAVPPVSNAGQHAAAQVPKTARISICYRQNGDHPSVL